jgi:hypothetical protein
MVGLPLKNYGVTGPKSLEGGNEMAHKYLKLARIAVIALVSSFGVAQAAAPSPPPEENLPALIKRNADGSLPQRGRIILKGAKGAALTLGWNFKVCTASIVSSPNATSFTVFARNADGTAFFESTSRGASNPIQNELVAACQHAGGGYWVHVTDTSSGLFDDVLIFYP